MDRIPEAVIENIRKYFQEHLAGYEVVKVRRKSCHEEDSYLYMVAGKNNAGSYAVWTSWNEQIQSLNHGHYGLADLETCERIIDEFYNGKSGDAFLASEDRMGHDREFSYNNGEEV